MEAFLGQGNLREVPVLLRGEAAPINAWIERDSIVRRWLYVGVIVLGSGLFGAAMGSWRAPEQALFTAIKFPLVILFTTLGNGLLNGLLAPLLGLNLRFRQSFLAVLMSQTITAAILGAFSPLIFFLVWNTPPMSADPHQTGPAHALLLLTEVALIAFAGLAGNARLRELLLRLSGSDAVARKILYAWLAGNLLLGSQLSWILRPFVGSPNLPVEFLRANAFEGNFLESVWQLVRHLFF